MDLAAYACHPTLTRGRRLVEAPSRTRSNYQRDRDRIVHSTAFRRLVYKTQVFLNHEGDLFRTRLTHSLEVAQLARSMARVLHLNEDLVEAIAFAHDLGHTPFGHAGQTTLNHCMLEWGGFEHNLQSLRVVDYLETRYPNFDGLNLCFETREGILKRCSRSNALLLEAQESRLTGGDGGVAQRFLAHTQPSLESQLCNLADEIAYSAHDIDDGVRSGLMTVEQLCEVSLFKDCYRQALSAWPTLGNHCQMRRLMYETIRRMLDVQVEDLLTTTQATLREAAPASVDDVRQLPVLVTLSASMQETLKDLKKFLSEKLYRHSKVEQTMQLAQQVMRDLFVVYCEAPHEMQCGTVMRSAMFDAVSGDDARIDHRMVADYIAGMTDRFALREHERLTGARLFD